MTLYLPHSPPLPPSLHGKIIFCEFLIAPLISFQFLSYYSQQVSIMADYNFLWLRPLPWRMVPRSRRERTRSPIKTFYLFSARISRRDIKDLIHAMFIGSTRAPIGSTEWIAESRIIFHDDSSIAPCYLSREHLAVKVNLYENRTATR